MTAEELKDIALCGETTTIQFKQEFTGQKEIAKEMIAFANTRGGKIIFGIKDKTGELLGLSYDDIQSTSRELGNTANEQVKPTIYIDTEVVRADGKLPTSEDLSGQWSDKLPDKVAINTDMVAINTDKGCDNAKNIAIKGKRQDILDYLSQHQSATSKDLSQLLAISTSRVKIYLNELEEAGLITPHGANKNRTYSIRTS